MRPKLFILIAAFAVGASGITIILVRVHDQNREAEGLHHVQTATTNMMREIKLLNAPPIFPEKKK